MAGVLQKMGCIASNLTWRLRRASVTQARGVMSTGLVLATTSPFIKLPSEIVVMIIGQLHGDKRALSACSLTCRGWLPFSRSHMFSRMVLAPKDLSTFVAFLEAPSSSMAQFVMCLGLDNMGHIHRTTEHESAIAAIPRLKSYLFRVTSLCLTNVNLKSPLLETIISTFCDIKELELYHMEFDTFLDFVNLVCAFPSLKTLSLSQLKWLHPHPGSWKQLTRPVFPLQLRLLDLCDGNATEVADWVLTYHSIPCIEVLHFDTHKYGPNNAIRRLIESAGQSMRELQFELTFANEIQDNLHNSIDLGCCSNLEVLHLHNIILLAGFIMTSKIPRWVPILLSQVTSCHMKEVVFTLLVHQNDDLEYFDWVEVGKALLRQQFTYLERIRVRMPGADLTKVDQANVEQVIREDKLPIFSARGILSIEFPG